MIMEQLDLFNIPSLEPLYEVGNRVRIKKANELSNPDVETVAYLTEYKFGGQVGTIRSIHKSSKAISYYVETKVGTAVVSENEVAFIS
jgi:hypothetical protein